jgi:hypothetical protein
VVTSEYFEEYPMASAAKLRERKEKPGLRRAATAGEQTEEWAGDVFREKLRPELEEAERERTRAFSLMWLPRSVRRNG